MPVIAILICERAGHGAQQASSRGLSRGTGPGRRYLVALQAGRAALLGGRRYAQLAFFGQNFTLKGESSAGRISNEGNLLALEDKRAGSYRAGGLRPAEQHSWGRRYAQLAVFGQTFTLNGGSSAGRITNEGNLLTLEDKRAGSYRAGGLRRQQSSGRGISLQAF